MVSSSSHVTYIIDTEMLVCLAVSHLSRSCNHRPTIGDSYSGTRERHPMWLKDSMTGCGESLGISGGHRNLRL
ncbi:hypothetical protein ACOSP7_000878 [Xanthoceras sorbifolium]